MAKDTNITLTVDTASITESTKNTAVVFSDDRGDAAETPGDPANYVSSVNKNYKVIWTGVGKDNVGTVQITNVSKEGGSEIMTNIKQTPNNSMTWQAKIKPDASDNDEESYTITIKVNNDSSKVFTIDPKLRISTTQ
ncbi:MAG: hypothetical protein HKO92_07720 [Flavobacteriaceae bacterium]|nr:hypothetical protein [Bacteroidia bacterium]NNK82996.1 hypothetical protein [Flavobacteriaceae bacterium]